jgi:tetratricopeptide (TPR) repeat protein
VREDVVREFRCFPEHSQSPFHPLAALLDDGPAAALPLSREQILAGMLDRLYAFADGLPQLMLFEDLHWADPSTLEFLVLLVAQAHARPLLVVFTARPEFHAPWDENRVRTLAIDAMNAAATAELIAAVAPGITAEATRRIAARADGVPLFAEEMARDASASASSIPATLHDLLAARLDRLGAVKHTAQLAAALGREFAPEVLHKVSTLTSSALAHALDTLQNAGLIVMAGASMRQFKHALIQEAAYQSLTRGDRLNAHRRIAEVLESDFPSVVATQPELLARHLTSGGETQSAVSFWIEAGKRACRLSASKEAVTHFESGLVLLETLPDDAGRVRLELDLQIGLGTAACAAEGYASAQGAAAYTRAIVLCGEHESGPDMFNSVWGLWASASSRAGYPAANKLAWQLLRMARQGDDPVQVQQAHFALADTFYWQGEFVTAREHLDRVAAGYRLAHHASHIANFGEDAGVTGGVYRAWVLLFLGYPDQARRACADALTLARQLGHPFSLAYALTFAAILHCRLRLPAEAEALARETLGLAQRHGYLLWQIGATITRGWSLAMQSRSEGVEIIRQCVEATRAAMGGVTLVVLEPLVDANTLLGLNADALAVGEEALIIGKTLGDHHADAELYRLKGEALLGLDIANAAPAEVAFRKALAISRKQQAKFLELRAATSLARLWQQQGQGAKARRLLAPVFGWFTEGFDTPDLQDARALLGSWQDRHYLAEEGAVPCGFEEVS